MKNTVSDFLFGDMRVRYALSDKGIAELTLFPASMEGSVKQCKGEADALIQIKLEGDAFPYGFANGHTMRGSASLLRFVYKGQTVTEEGNTTTVVTSFADAEGLEAKHILSYTKGEKGLRIHTEVINNGGKAHTLEMLSSFSIAGITPFADDEATDRLLLHRIRSKWSGEGRVETRTIEDMLLEPSWSRWGAYSEKFGQIGSMPVRKYFPWIAVEDKAEGVIWAACLCCPSSWQLEAYRRDENLCISGGLPDYDFGHWRKTLDIGESYIAPEAYVTVAKCDFTAACQRLTAMQKRAEYAPGEKLPVLFNEFCTTWGNPCEDNIDSILRSLKGHDIDYFVIDAGWYADKENGWESNMGDWIVAEHLFPKGLETTARRIASAGMKPGIWFEVEVVGETARAYSLTDHLLKRNGSVITSGARRFWDMRDPWVKGYLTEKVIDMLKRYGFEYIKIDYNDSIGVGCDGAESLGEGLRGTILATQDFFRSIKEALPQVKLEMCSSGGHRLEPSMLALSDFASFSDAHEEKEIPIIAANVHRTMLPEKSQIWAVIRKDDTIRRIVYSIASTFLGVMCISGDVFDLNDEQWGTIDRGIAFYREASGLIRSGASEIFGPEQSSYRKPRGWQAVIRKSEDGSEAMAVIHTFDISSPEEIALPVAAGYTVERVYSASGHAIELANGTLCVHMPDSFDAVAIRLKK